MQKSILTFLGCFYVSVLAAQVHLQRTVVGASGQTYNSSSRINVVSATHQSSLVGAKQSNSLQLYQGFIQPRFQNIPLTAFEFEVYPNPSTGKVTVSHTNESTKVLMKVINLEGKEMFSANFKRKQTLTPDWPKGIYHILLYSEGQFLGNRKLILR